MSKDKISYRPLNKRVLIKAKVKTNSNGILLPFQPNDYKDMLNKKKDVAFYDETIVAIGDKVETNVSVGQAVHVKHYGMVFLNEKDIERIKIEKENDELFYLVEEENLLAVMD